MITRYTLLSLIPFTMKIHVSPILLFLLPAISTTVADLAPTNPVVAQRDITNANGEVLGASSQTGSKGTPDVPVDGKDGKPHEGPWVETNTNKQTAGQGGSPEKFDSTVSSLAQGKPSDGVSGKQKGSGEKVPEGPKEAPPLPHSEQRKIPTSGDVDGKDTRDGGLGVHSVWFDLPG